MFNNKKLLIPIIVLICFISCKSKSSTEYYVFGTDTLIIEGRFNTDVSKVSSSHGYLDTVNDVFIVEINPSKWQRPKAHFHADTSYSLSYHVDVYYTDKEGHEDTLHGIYGYPTLMPQLDTSNVRTINGISGHNIK